VLVVNCAYPIRLPQVGRAKRPPGRAAQRTRSIWQICQDCPYATFLAHDCTRWADQKVAFRGANPWTGNTR